MSHAQNIARIKVVYESLEELGPEVVFVGGATVSLYADRPAGEIRPTEDVDILVEMINYRGYAEMEEKLRAKGFVNDMDSGVICRYRIHGVVVDVMPTDEGALGFSNHWYPEGYANAISIDLGNKCVVKIFRAPYFIAAKLEAFRNRGEGDGRMSTDFEDIVFVLNNRNQVWDEIREAKPAVKGYLQQQFLDLLEMDHLYEWVGAHLEYVEQRRVNYIIGGLTNLVDNSQEE